MLEEKFTNARLTIEELREMSGEPVYLLDLVNPEQTEWLIWEDAFENTFLNEEGRKNYNRTWAACRYV